MVFVLLDVKIPHVTPSAVKRQRRLWSASNDAAKVRSHEHPVIGKRIIFLKFAVSAATWQREVFVSGRSFLFEQYY